MSLARICNAFKAESSRFNIVLNESRMLKIDDIDSLYVIIYVTPIAGELIIDYYGSHLIETCNDNKSIKFLMKNRSFDGKYHSESKNIIFEGDEWKIGSRFEMYDVNQGTYIRKCSISNRKSISIRASKIKNTPIELAFSIINNLA